MSLFERGEFKLHSGAVSRWKIECDNLSDEDIATLAWLASNRFEFGVVVPIPRGGFRFAKALEPYAQRGKRRVIVDDVLTTGGSMEAIFEEHPNAFGLVIFSRGPCPFGVTAMFQTPAWLWGA